MKFINYLKSNKCKLCDEQKLLIFDDIKSQITKESIFSKISFYTKVGVYSFILVFVFSGLFLTFPNKISDNVKVYNKTDSVYADYIGKVIKYKGDFNIYDDNKLLNTNLIRLGNTIVLDNNSYIKVNINNGIKAYLLGPAKVKIDLDKKTNTYILNLIDGDYLTIKSNSNKDSIVLKSKFLDIKSNNKRIDIDYKKENGINIVENNGGDIVVERENKKIKLTKKEKLIVLSDIDKKYIENLFSDDYTKYQLNNGNIKTILSSTDLKKFDIMLDKENVVISIGKYVLGKVNNDDKLKKMGKQQILSTMINLYILLGEKLPISDLKNISEKDLEYLVENLLNTLNDHYILPETYTQRLKVILSYIMLSDKVNIPSGLKFSNLSSFVNYLKIDKKYKKILLEF